MKHIKFLMVSGINFDPKRCKLVVTFDVLEILSYYPRNSSIIVCSKKMSMDILLSNIVACFLQSFSDIYHQSQLGSDLTPLQSIVCYLNRQILNCQQKILKLQAKLVMLICNSHIF